jgi:hypothetical protein
LVEKFKEVMTMAAGRVLVNNEDKQRNINGWRNEKMANTRGLSVKPESPKKLCPFSWSEFYTDAYSTGCLPFVGAILSLFGFSTKKRIIEPVDCVGNRCKMWDKDIDDCIFVNIKHLGSGGNSQKGNFSGSDGSITFNSPFPPV